MTRRLVAVLSAVVAVVAVASPAIAANAVDPTTRINGVPVHPCDLGVGHPTVCGTIRTPLDPTDDRAGTIAIGFEWVPASETAAGTILAMEGGPGYPSSGSAVDFARMLGPMLDQRNLLLVDERGTGRSTLIDCEPLQSLPAMSPKFVAALTACGRQLNHTFPRQGGGFVHASDLFTTANTARDTAAVIRRLGVGQVDLFGDSYGTYFSQSFLSRYPHLLRSVVLDSAYEARDLDPWYRTAVTTARRAFTAVCAHSVACPAPAATSWVRISQLASMLRTHPVHGRVVGTDAKLHRITVGVTALVNIVNDAGYDTDPYRQLDAAAAAYIAEGDPTPLLRLYAQDVGYDYSDSYAPPSYFSDGLYFAIACSDYPQLFDMRSPQAQRHAQLDDSIAALPADTFAPFTTREWIRMNAYVEPYTACLHWPTRTHPADRPVPPGQPFNPRHLPVLILNGNLDSLTPAVGGEHIARQLGSSAQHYVAVNTVHLVALDNVHPCGRRVVRAFITDPSAALDTSCLPKIPPIHAVAQFPASFADARPAHGYASQRVRRSAAVAIAAAGDAVHRFNYVDAYDDLGLRGGRIHYDLAGNPTLIGVRWTTDSRVTGSVHASGPGYAGTLTVTNAHRPVTFTVKWGAGQYATASGAGATLAFPAP